MDLGPVYIQVVIFLRETPKNHTYCNFYSETFQGTFYFTKVHKEEYQSFKHSDLYNKLEKDGKPVPFTGIRYDKFHEKIAQEYNVELVSHVKTAGTIKAIDSFWNCNKFGFYKYKGDYTVPKPVDLRFAEEEFEKKDLSDEPGLYPYILLNIRSGVSVHLVESKTQFRKLGGSSIGGATFWALMKLGGYFAKPEEGIDAALRGDNTQADMTVKDIYGGSYEVLGLDASIIASSCGKMQQPGLRVDSGNYAKSVLLLMLYNMTQLTSFHAKLENINKVLVVGNAIHSQEINMFSQFAMNYWTSGEISLVQSEYGNYFGAFGVLANTLEE